jgi:hypothetical protein
VENPVENSELVTEYGHLKIVKLSTANLCTSRDLSTVKRPSYPQNTRVINRVIHRTHVRRTPVRQTEVVPQTFRPRINPLGAGVLYFYGVVRFVLCQGLVLSMFWMAVGVMAGCVFWVLFCRVW